jgi:hypothetical protein
MRLSRYDVSGSSHYRSLRSPPLKPLNALDELVVIEGDLRLLNGHQNLLNKRQPLVGV